MALKLVINISKKVPGPQEYSSVQASCSIEGELAAGQDPATEAHRLYTQAEAAVDHQLYRTPQASVPRSVPTQPASGPQPGPNAATRPAATVAPNPARRAPAPVTDGQLRFINRLITQGAGSLDAILADYQIGDLRHLSCKDAAGLIDSLKAKAA